MSGRDVSVAGLSARELEVLHALRDRPTNAELAARFYISERTVESHVSSLLRKLGASSRLELARLAATYEESEAIRNRLPAPLELLADHQSFFGRGEHLSALLTAWDQAAAGRVLVRFVTGEAGIGKSRLVAELASEVQRRGGAVRFGACFEDSPMPFEPFRQALVDVAPALGGAHGRPSLAPTLPPERALRSLEADAESTDAARSVAAALAGLPAASPYLVVVEDLHWATPPTRRVVAEVARVSTVAPLLVVITARDAPPDLDDDLARLIGDLDHRPTVAVHRLDGLDCDAVGSLLQWLGDSEDPSALHAETGGNPLLLRERSALGRPTGTIQSLLSQRDRLLPESDVTLLEIAAAIGVELSVDLLAAAAHITVEHAVEAVERATAVGIVAPLPGRPGTYTFVHALLRRARYERLPMGRRLRVHADIATALEQRGGSVDVRARHACLAAPLSDAAGAAQLAMEAGDAISNLTDPEAAGLRYQWGLEVVDLAEPPEPALRLRLMVRLGQSLAMRGDSRARDLLARAARDARTAGDVTAMAEAALSMAPAPGGAATPGRADPEFTGLAEDVLGRLGPEPCTVRVKLLAALGVQLRMGGDARRGLAFADEAVAVARAAGDPEALGYALLAWRFGGARHDDVNVREKHADELTSLGVRLGQPALVHAGLWQKASAQRQRGALGAAAATLAHLPRLAAPWSLFIDEAGSITDDFLAGDLATARRRTDDLAARAAVQGEAFELLSSTLDTIVRHYEGRVFERASAVRRRARDTQFVLTDAALALALAHGAHASEATAILDRYLDAPPEAPWRCDYSFLLALAAMADAASVVEHHVAARRLLDLLEPHTGELAAITAFVFGSIDYHRADLMLLAGDADDAVIVAERAVTQSREHETPLFLARELVVLAAARAAAGGVVPTDLCEERGRSRGRPARGSSSWTSVAVRCPDAERRSAPIDRVGRRWSGMSVWSCCARCSCRCSCASKSIGPRSCCRPRCRRVTRLHGGILARFDGSARSARCAWHLTRGVSATGLRVRATVDCRGPCATAGARVMPWRPRSGRCSPGVSCRPTGCSTRVRT